MELQINQNFKSLIPPLNAEEYENLKESIKQEGVRDALIVWNGTLIDGHNRYEICQELNIDFETVEKQFNDENEAVEWIMFNQLARRNLSDVERGRIALKLKDKIAAKAKENCKLGGGDKKSENAKSGLANLPKAVSFVNTRQEIAKAANISPRTLAKIEKVDKEAPTVIKEAMGKSISVDKADKLNNVLKFVPEQDREEEARRLIEKEFEEKCKEIDRQHKICNKLHDIIYISAKYFEYGTDEDVDIYISNAVEKTSDIIVGIDDTIAYLQELKKKFVERNGIRRVK